MCPSRVPGAGDGTLPSWELPWVGSRCPAAMLEKGTSRNGPPCGCPRAADHGEPVRGDHPGVRIIDHLHARRQDQAPVEPKLLHWRDVQVVQRTADELRPGHQPAPLPPDQEPVKACQDPLRVEGADDALIRDPLPWSIDESDAEPIGVPPVGQVPKTIPGIRQQFLSNLAHLQQPHAGEAARAEAVRLLEGAGEIGG
jgi:hypothetical protein